MVSKEKGVILGNLVMQLRGKKVIVVTRVFLEMLEIKELLVFQVNVDKRGNLVNRLVHLPAKSVILEIREKKVYLVNLVNPDDLVCQVNVDPRVNLDKKD